MTRHLVLFLSLCFVLLFTACEDEDPIIENEEEVITAVTLTLFPNGPQEQVVLGFSDPDGDGGNAPVFSTTGNLIANAEYRGMISFANDMGSIDAEIVDEGAEHQVFYQPSNGLGLTFAYDDTDLLGQPLGLSTLLMTGAAGSGDLTVTLRHEPLKTAAGIAIDNPTPAGGETDIEVTFPITIQ